MNIDDIARPSPEFDFRAHFLGHMRASGWFADRFGNVRRHFCGDFHGSYDGDIFVLDESLEYSDGVSEKRQWRVTIDEQGNFRAESKSLVGDAIGRLLGNTLQLKYRMNVELANDKTWELKMNDWMFLQPDGSLHNITQVYKWGLRIGSVNTQYSRVEESEASSNDGEVAQSRFACAG